MKKIICAAACASLILPLILAANSTGTSIRFAPEEGLSLTKTYGQISSSVLVGVHLSRGEEEMDVDEVPEVTITSVETIVFEDTYDSVAGGRPTLLTRHFAELGRERTSVNPDEETQSSKVSDLTELDVVYEWDEDEEAYSKTYGEDVEEGDEDLLQPTECDADLLGFLPGEDVDEGDSWEVDIAAWKLLVEPGGDLNFVDSEGEEEDEDEDEIDREIDETMAGDIECTFTGTREEDGVIFAVIEVAVDLEGEGDLEKDVDFENEELSSVTQRRSLTVSIEFEGELLWNITAGHAASFTAAGESTVEMTDGMEFETTDGETFIQNQVMTFDTEREIEITFE